MYGHFYYICISGIAQHLFLSSGNFQRFAEKDLRQIFTAFMYQYRIRKNTFCQSFIFLPDDGYMLCVHFRCLKNVINMLQNVNIYLAFYQNML